MSFSLFKPVKNTLEYFDFTYADHLFVENRLADWIGEKKADGTEIKSLSDFFQPNYIPTQMQAFFWGLDTIPDELNFSWISQLHYLASRNLFHEKGSPIRHSIRRNATYLDFPTILAQVAYGAANKASSTGIESMNKELSDPDDEETKGKVIFGLRDPSIEDDDAFRGQVLDAETAKQYYEQQLIMFNQHASFFTDMLIQHKINPATIFASGMNLTENDKAVVKEAIQKIIAAGYGPLLKQVGYCLLNRNPFQIRAKAEKMIRIYNQRPKNTETEKLDAIISLVKGLLNLHVWPDGNGRLCAHHLLNLLLIKNGLCPALLKNNCLDAFDPEELRERIREGMKLFNAKCTSKESMYERFRKDNELPRAVESSFITAILQNRIEKAKKYLQGDAVVLTNKGLEFFASCSQANVDWLIPYFSAHHSMVIDGKSYQWDDMIEKIISLAMQNANENLLISLLGHCMNKNIDISSDQLDEIVTYGNFRMYQILKPVIENPHVKIPAERLFRLIVGGRDAETVSALMDICFAEEKNIQAVSYQLIEQMFMFQQPSIIVKFLEVSSVKDYFPSPLSMGILTTHLINTISARNDLTAVEKNHILQKINPSLKFDVVNPLTDFSKPAFKFLS